MSFPELPDLAAYFTAQASLWAVFAASLLASTLFPIASEAVLLATVKARPELFWPALILATTANTAGGMITYWMGRGLHAKLNEEYEMETLEAKIIRYRPWLDRFGASTLLFAWAPLVGDMLCLVAGWLKLPTLACAAWMTLGRFARYAVVASLAGLM
ncbi:YqaA family protein [Ampullimonas aquatilis]|uniref:YqaA family protein n=1 Tax=Ampullimonas aquatilis TaxID=1341549 RepID=UPI003C72DB01